MSDLTTIMKARHAASQTHGIFAIRKDGTVAAKPSTTDSSEERAEAVKVRMLALNPGKQYVVKAL